ncbi:hypothetical protein MSHRCOH1_07125 [Candidatus Ornithobacterium hominis]|nr:hypothetical protein MSHRCOH1_07125 [Candidatus Ornithobacterium hominis]
MYQVDEKKTHAIDRLLLKELKFILLSAKNDYLKLKIYQIFADNGIFIIKL